jgi:uncharacterized protein YndB with AHSA1/START domain
MTVQGMFSTTINASPEAVWPWVAELEKHSEWSPKPYLVQRVSGTPGSVGSTYRSEGWIPGDSTHVNTVEITEVVPGERLVLRADEEMGSFHNAYRLAPVDGGTQVTYELVFPPLKGAQKLMLALLFPLVGKPNIRKRMRLLKAKVESAQADSAARS